MIYSERMFGRRLRREGGHRIPVIVLTGFLGAGKTTLLQHLLSQPEGANTAIVVNEFGEVGIDNALLRESADVTMLLDRGCLCCAVRTDLQQTLAELLASRLAGKVPSFERVVIETSGFADPTPILQTFLADQRLSHELYLLAVAAVVDVAVWGNSQELPPEAVKQVALADRIIFTKADLVSESTVSEVVRRVRDINPGAAQTFAENGAVSPSFLLDDSGRIGRGGAFAEEVHHLPNVSTFSLVFDNPLHWDGFARAMESLRALRAPDLLRVKGFLALRECAGPVLVQFVQHLAHQPMELAEWPDDDHRSRLVFIVRGLSKENVLNLLEAHQAICLPRQGNPLQ